MLDFFLPNNYANNIQLGSLRFHLLIFHMIFLQRRHLYCRKQPAVHCIISLLFRPKTLHRNLFNSTIVKRVLITVSSDNNTWHISCLASPCYRILQYEHNLPYVETMYSQIVPATTKYPIMLCAQSKLHN